MKVAPGLELEASGRGLRVRTGPSVAPVHVAAPHGSRVTLAQLEQQARSARRAAQITAVAEAEAALVQLHLENFPAGRPAVIPVPGPPTAADLLPSRRAAIRAATRGLHRWKRSARREAAAAAVIEADDAVARRHLAAVIATQREQLDLDAEWAGLHEHDPLIVVSAVDQAFADNACDSTCVDAGQDGPRYITCAVLFAGPGLVPGQKPIVTAKGKATLRARDQEERHDLYLRALAATVLATAKEGLAVAVAADEARIVVVRPRAESRTPTGTGSTSGSAPGTTELRTTELAVIYTGRFSRNLAWTLADPVSMIQAAPDAQLLRAPDGGVADLPPSPDPDLQALLTALTPPP